MIKLNYQINKAVGACNTKPPLITTSTGSELTVMTASKITPKEQASQESKLPPRVIDETGNRYGQLFVKKFAYTKTPGPAIWECICDCGETAFVKGIDLRAGRRTSCGCLRGKLWGNHGYCNHKLYIVWARMVQRCRNKKEKSYINYGGRGIYVCDDWEKDPKTFIGWAIANGWRYGLQLDRINNNEGYYPENCRFVTPAENAANQRRIRKNNKTGFVGVAAHRGGYCATICVNMRQIYLGKFKSLIEAAKARDNYIIANNLKHNTNLISKQEGE